MPIDEKLRDILYTLRESKASNVRVMPDAIAQIKQAFTDAGYVHLPNVKPGDYFTINAGTAVLNGEGTMTKVDYMSGKAWYDRFIKEINAIPYSPLRYHEIMEAAKRAANIEDKT